MGCSIMHCIKFLLLLIWCVHTRNHGSTTLGFGQGTFDSMPYCPDPSVSSHANQVPRSIWELSIPWPLLPSPLRPNRIRCPVSWFESVYSSWYGAAFFCVIRSSWKYILETIGIDYLQCYGNGGFQITSMQTRLEPILWLISLGSSMEVLVLYQRKRDTHR